MQHVYGHTRNLGTECANHAAALGALGLVSNHIPRFWVRHNFDTSTCFDACNNIGEVLEKWRCIRTEAASLPQDGSWCCVPHRVLCDFHARVASLVILLSAPFSARSLSTVLCCTSSEAMEAPNSCLYCFEFWWKFRT